MIGISSDSVESHKAFAEKHGLPFALLADTDGSVRKGWGVGKTLGLLPGRVTYVIDPEHQKVGARIVAAPRHEPYGSIVNLPDPQGNRFDRCAYD